VAAANGNDSRCPLADKEATTRFPQLWTITGVSGPAAGALALRLAVWMWLSVTSEAEEKVPTGGELTLFEAVDPVGLTSFCCVARRRSGMSGVT
jgi:hypothetical protein